MGRGSRGGLWRVLGVSLADAVAHRGCAPHHILLRVALWRNWTDALPVVLAAQCQGERRRLEEEGVTAYPFSVWWCLTGCGSPSSDEEEVAAGGKAAAEEEGEAAGGVEGGI